MMCDKSCIMFLFISRSSDAIPIMPYGKQQIQVALQLTDFSHPESSDYTETPQSLWEFLCIPGNMFLSSGYHVRQQISSRMLMTFSWCLLMFFGFTSNCSSFTGNISLLNDSCIPHALSQISHLLDFKLVHFMYEHPSRKLLSNGDWRLGVTGQDWN